MRNHADDLIDGVAAIVLANLCVCFIMTLANDTGAPRAGVGGGWQADTGITVGEIDVGWGIRPTHSP